MAVCSSTIRYVVYSDCLCCRYGPPAVRHDSRIGDQVDSKYNPAPLGYRPEMSKGADIPRGGGPGVGRGVPLNRAIDMNRPAGYHSDRYNPPPPAANRYQETPGQPAVQQRGYPVGRDSRDSVQTSDSRDQMPNSYPAPAQHHNNINRPYNNSIVSKPAAHYNGPTSMTSSYQQQPQPSSNSQFYNNNSKQISSGPYPNPTGNMGQGYRPPQPGGSYNAGAMNRQINQQMYNYYDGNKPTSQSSERQPPIGQNSFDNRGSSSQPSYPNYSNDPRYNAPSAYKAMDYGPQGMIRNNNNATAPTNPSAAYGSTVGQMRPPSHSNNYNDQPLSSNPYYSRQPAAYP